MAGLAIGLVQTTSTLMPELGGRVAAIVLAAVAVFETIGPPLCAMAIRFSGEAGKAKPEASSVDASPPAPVIATPDAPASDRA